ncbi:AAA family ATPase [Sorangium sp. So ce513]|uniref:AAA family ATPase n=1 Tax=Sorangium sp. So ce513 TaxID=3133315 RepID=UPI003F5E13A8
MSLSFNTAGPCIPGEHYMLPPGRRLGPVLEHIENRKYFTLHAGRQTGKTTSARWLVEHLNREGRFRAAWVDLQIAREEPDPAKAFEAVLYALDTAVDRDLPDLGRPADDVRRVDPASTFVLRYLRDLAARSDRPLVVLFDEADGLVGASMVSFLTQLRQGYLDRSQTAFPSSVALIGQRQVRDYALAVEERRTVAWLGTTSPFNITAEATTLGPFTEAEVAELLAQHTAATGQRFEPEAVRRIWELGQGHPWLTNAMADQIVRRDVRDHAVPITPAHVEAAKETLILERRSHIDSLIARLREPRVRRVLDPMLAGGQTAGDVLDDDFSYVLGLGLIRFHGGRFEIANPIYREVVPRALTFIRQAQIPAEPAAYVRADGSLDMGKLFTDWQAFWRKDGHLAAEGFGYRESGPHLMLMAFLQRVVNGGGRVEREYGLGRGALDLMICWRDERHAIEVKVRRDTETEVDALDQVTRYLDHAGLGEGWLVMFDLRKERSWAERLFVREVAHRGKTVRIVGC